MKLHAVGGLCNRLRAILSWARPVTVIWEPDEYVSFARFEDVFRPLSGVEFRYRVETWDVEAWAPMPGAGAGWEERYRELVTVDDYRSPLPGSYVAIHVRRTDQVPDLERHGLRPRTLNHYAAWAHQWQTLPVHVATDNGETQAQLLSLLGSRGIVGRRLEGRALQELHDHRRNGTLHDAVRDLVRCADALHFLGSPHSSFTDTINVLRRFRGLEAG
jgi:hypothetical protein